MSTSIGLSDALVAYLSKVNPPEHPALVRCRMDTAALGGISSMQISAEQGVFTQMMARLVSAKTAFEVGVFTGYSSTATALAMQDMHGGAARLLACDVSEEWTAKARGYWREANVESVIDLHLAPALATLDARLAAGEAGLYDFGFIDADKPGYDSYYERGLKLLRPGGLMLFDNMFWGGEAPEAGSSSPELIALRALALKARTDPRVHAGMIGVGDGVLMCIKK